jgi:predicted ArsR family transcriptional regulator
VNGHKIEPTAGTPEVVLADSALLDILRRAPAQSIAELARAMGVTATAVRQRLTRLMAQGLVRRTVLREGRGRPRHQYELTGLGRKSAGVNFADLAMALWHELRQIADPAVRQGLLQRIAQRLAETYSSQINGESTEARLTAVAELFSSRRIPLEVERRQQLPVLRALSCPYPELAEQDRAVCAMERMLFSDLAGVALKLDECRLDGQPCCTFVPSQN